MAGSEDFDLQPDSPAINTGSSAVSSLVTDDDIVPWAGASDIGAYKQVNSPLTATQAVASTTLTENHAATAFTLVTGSGGTAPLGYAITAGTLPAGLRLSSTSGAITGSATATSASASYTVTVTDSNGVTATQAAAAISLAPNQPVTPFTPVIGGGGTGALFYSRAPALPTGLSLAAATGTISGTPTAAATNALTGTPNTPVTIAGKKGAQSFVLSFQGTTAVTAAAMPIDFGCAGTAPAAVATGVDTVDPVLSTAPIADIIALAATDTGTGLV